MATYIFSIRIISPAIFNDWEESVLQHQKLGDIAIHKIMMKNPSFHFCFISKQLTWRDVQHLIVRTSRPNREVDNREKWIINGAGLMGTLIYLFNLSLERYACSIPPLIIADAALFL